MSSNHVITKNRKNNDPFRCRLCQGSHPLRLCEAFLKMDVEKRLQAVSLFDYCPNCLAHVHSEKSCFHKTGCHICSKQHHTLLHSEESSRDKRSRETSTLSRVSRIKRDNTPNRRDGISTTSQNDSISSIVSRHLVPLLPTANVIVVSNNNRQTIRALIDVCSEHSRIEQQLADTLQLKTYQLNATYAILMLTAKHDRQFRVAVDARIVGRLPMKTPSASLNSSVLDKFSHLLLPDDFFYVSQGISFFSDWK